MSMKGRHVKRFRLGVHRLHLSSPFSFPMKRRHVRVHRSSKIDSYQKVDYISELPDEILSYIQSMISIKDMMKTSVLSKRWRNLWHLRRDLKFDVHNMFDEELPNQRCIRDEIFVKGVDQFLKNFKGTKIDSFQFDYSNRCSTSVDEWIRFAIPRGVERIDLHTGSNLYKFPFGLFSECNNNNPTLKHIRLRHCELVCHNNPTNLAPFTNLRSLKLRGSHVDANLFTSLLSNCLLLEELSLLYCKFYSSSLTIVSSSLYHLKLEECENHGVGHFEFISLDCQKLTSLYYDNTYPWRLLMNTPILKTIYHRGYHIGGDSPRAEKIHEAFSRFATLPKLETLDLYIYNTYKIAPLQSIEILKNVREFNLIIGNTYTDTNVFWIFPILHALPSLQRLSVMMRHNCKYRAKQRDNQDHIMLTHGEIKVVELGGCVGNWYETEFAINALKYFHKLEQIVLSPYCTITSFSDEDSTYDPIWF